jgi:predicted acyltransferase
MATTITESNMRPLSKPVETVPNATVTKRFVAVDALRGFDMFWILGADAVGLALKGVKGNRVTQWIATQLEHEEWQGLRFYDLIFPLFLFLVGVSMVFSLDRTRTAGRSATLVRIVRRSGLLFALGLFYYGGLSQPLSNMRWGGVLQHIAICYFFAACVYCVVRTPKGLLAVSVGLLIGYWALLTFVPFPDLKLDTEVIEPLALQVGSQAPHDVASAVEGRVRGVYEDGRNLTHYLDYRFMPGHRNNKGYYTNMGLLSIMSSVALVLLGSISGQVLNNPRIAPKRKVAWLAAAGAACLVLGLAWSLQFPIIKRIWTSSYVLVSAGLSMWLLAFFYLLIDVYERRTWCLPFIWIGSNAIALYLISRIVDFKGLADRFVGGDIGRYLNTHVAAGISGIATTSVAMLLILLLARWLYRRNIFVRV